MSHHKTHKEVKAWTAVRLRNTGRAIPLKLFSEMSLAKISELEIVEREQIQILITEKVRTDG